MNDSGPIRPAECLPEERDLRNLTQDRRLNTLLYNVLNEVRNYAESQIHQIRKLSEIGLALSAEKDINRLLEMIVDEARALSFADAGTLYIKSDDERNLRFVILQNDTMETRLGGVSGAEIRLPGVPLYIDGKPNYANVSSYVALTGRIANIEDVYHSDLFDFTGPKKYDKATGYKSRSMLVIPLKNHEDAIIGVLQLLNAKDEHTGEVMAFSEEYVDLVASLASQAAVALTNAQLIRDLKELFYAFIKSIATAIDEKSPYTGGHITRVVQITMMIAERINETIEGPLAEVRFSEDELEELRLAAWMHDVGKITTPEHVVDKGTKLETIFDRIALLDTRFELIAASLEKERLAARLDRIEKTGLSADLSDIDAKYDQLVKEAEDAAVFVRRCNTPGEFMADEDIARVRELARRTYSHNGDARPWLTDNEVENLTIRKGTLTDKERLIIQDHVRMSLKMLSELPFPKRYANVPEYAGSHHEKLDGSGYHRGLMGAKLPLQARIMAIADIFEALTAKDRPYKEPMKLSQAVRILGFMEKDKHLDPDVLSVLIDSGLYLEYAQDALKPEQIDIEIPGIGNPGS